MLSRSIQLLDIGCSSLRFFCLCQFNSRLMLSYKMVRWDYFDFYHGFWSLLYFNSFWNWQKKFTLELCSILVDLSWLCLAVFYCNLKCRSGRRQIHTARASSLKSWFTLKTPGAFSYDKTTLDFSFSGGDHLQFREKKNICISWLRKKIALKPCKNYLWNFRNLKYLLANL